MKINILALTKKAYTAYGQTMNFQDHLGNPISNWASLPEKAQKAWTTATQQIHDDIKAVINTEE